MTDAVLRLPPGEPAFGPWRPTEIPALLSSVGFARAMNDDDGPRPFILAVDGRGASGKSTLADAIAEAVPAAAVIHTDDLAWNEPYFEWGYLLRTVLVALRAGGPVTFRPPAWERLGRPGALEFAPDLDLVVVEGVGASQREVVDLLDASVWVQSDWTVAEERGIERDVAHGMNGDRAQTIAFWHEWMAHELAFLELDRPWEHATAAVLGTPPRGAAARWFSTPLRGRIDVG